MHKKLTAFTLAEVLITLGVIGVVCALTMPNLIANYQKKVTVQQLKAAYNIFSNAIEHAKIDYGDPITLSEDITNYSSEISVTYFEPYIKGVEPYPRKSITVKCPNKNTNCESFSGYSNQNPKCLPNGTCYKIYRHGTGYIRFYFDLNGPKGPNVMGRDVFELDMTPPANKECFYGGGFHCAWNPHPYVDGYHHGLGTISINASCSKTSGATGFTCASKIIRDGWEIKDDYPW